MGFMHPMLNLDSVPGETLIGHNQVVAGGVSVAGKKTQDSLRQEMGSHGRNKPTPMASVAQKWGFLV